MTAQPLSTPLELAIDPTANNDTVVPLRSDGGGISDPTERQIAADLVAGHRTALEQAFRRWADLVHAIARQMVGRDAADDVTQLTFVAAWRSREQFDPERGEVPGWLVGITRNVARRHLRRRAPIHLELADDLDATAGPADDEQVIDALVVAATLQDLPASQRVVLELTLLSDLTQAEAATELGVPLGTVKSRQRRGLARLRGRMVNPL